MTPQEAADIDRQRDDLAPLHPTHDIAARRRAAQARLRRPDARGLRDKPDAGPLDRLDDDFAQIFGGRNV